jgi:hypothetical protein
MKDGTEQTLKSPPAFNEFESHSLFSLLIEPSIVRQMLDDFQEPERKKHKLITIDYANDIRFQLLVNILALLIK